MKLARAMVRDLGWGPCLWLAPLLLALALTAVLAAADAWINGVPTEEELRR